MMKKKFSSCLSSRPVMYMVVAIMLVMAISSCPVAHCSEVVVQAAHDASSVAYPDGGHFGMAPPAPHGGPVYAYDVPPPPEPQLRRLLQRAGR
ncbi:unnamed protein product [Urochloa humidicola]